MVDYDTASDTLDIMDDKFLDRNSFVNITTKRTEEAPPSLFFYFLYTLFDDDIVVLSSLSPVVYYQFPSHLLPSCLNIQDPCMHHESCGQHPTNQNEPS